MDFCFTYSEREEAFGRAGKTARKNSRMLQNQALAASFRRPQHPLLRSIVRALYIIRYLSGFLSSASAGEGLFSRLFAEEGRDKKKMPEKMKKSLHSMDAYGIIIERDCTRYAKKWKVATL